MRFSRSMGRRDHDETYAENTSVSVEKSRIELDRMLAGAGATSRGVGSDDAAGVAWVVFRLSDRHVKLSLPLPKLEQFKRAPIRSRVTWTSERQREAWEQACRSSWRALVLLVKAKLEAIHRGISTVEREFLADVYLSDGRTVHEALVTELQRMYVSGKMPALLGPAPKVANGELEGELEG